MKKRTREPLARVVDESGLNLRIPIQIYTRILAGDRKRYHEMKGAAVRLFIHDAARLPEITKKIQAAIKAAAK